MKKTIATVLAVTALVSLSIVSCASTGNQELASGGDLYAVSEDDIAAWNEIENREAAVRAEAPAPEAPAPEAPAPEAEASQ